MAQGKFRLASLRGNETGGREENAVEATEMLIVNAAAETEVIGTGTETVIVKENETAEIAIAIGNGTAVTVRDIESGSATETTTPPTTGSTGNAIGMKCETSAGSRRVCGARPWAPSASAVPLPVC